MTVCHRNACFGCRSRLFFSMLFGLSLLGCESSTNVPTSKLGAVDKLSFKPIETAEEEASLRKLCSQCHLFTAPDSLMKADWDSVVRRMAALPGYGKTVPKRIDIVAIKQWFEERAPEKLLLADRSELPIQPPPLKRVAVAASRFDSAPFVSQLLPFVDSRSKTLGLLSCDMRTGFVRRLQQSGADWSSSVVSDQVPHACRVHAVDLDSDGVSELIVANLGSFPAMDHNLGSVDWLRPVGDGWERAVLADNLGRVADVRPFDFDNDGDIDLAVAEFGWRTTGRVLLLENTTRRSGKPGVPTFIPRTIDERHGTVQIEIADINLDGRPDMIALLAQEHERLIAYLNQPDGSMKAHELFRAPHAVWGSSGFQLLDFDGDNDLDVLMTNGDMMDGPTIKPYHCVSWLENLGELKFEPHVLAELPGAHRAEAVDLDGDGDFDIVACTLVPQGTDQQAPKQNASVPPAMIWLEQTSPGQFEFHVWQRGPGRYPTLVTGDFDGDNKPDVALGIGLWEKPRDGTADLDGIELWLSGSGENKAP